jgi:hypothetical protein
MKSSSRKFLQIQLAGEVNFGNRLWLLSQERGKNMQFEAGAAIFPRRGSCHRATECITGNARDKQAKTETTENSEARSRAARERKRKNQDTQNVQRD